MKDDEGLEYPLEKTLIDDIQAVNKMLEDKWQYPVSPFQSASEEGYGEDDISELGYEIKAIENGNGYLIYEKGWLD